MRRAPSLERRAPTPLLLLLLLSGGCGDGETDAPELVAVTDSAGITVVEVRGPTWDEGGEWRVRPEPRLRIGTLEGAPEEELHHVADAAIADDGSVVIADGGSGEIRIFDDSGDHVRSFGRAGDGPGEFRAVRALRLDGDTLLVYDARPGRITRFDLAGRPLGVTTLEVPEGRRPPSRVAWLPDGGVVGAVAWAEPTGGSRTVPDGELRRDPVALLRFDEDGRLADTLLVHPGSEVFHVSSAEEGGVFRTFETTPPFGRVSVWAGGAAAADAAAGVDGVDGVWLGTGEEYELRYHDSHGAVRRIVRHPGGEVPLDPVRIDSARASALEGVDSPRFRRMVDLLYRRDHQPSVLPPYSAMVTDVEGNVWVREYRPPEGRAVRWDVFRPDGTLLGGVELPARFRPLRIGRDRMLGVATDELDVERVEVLALTR